MSNKKNYYKVKEVCNITGFSRATIYSLIHNGIMPSIKVGKQYLVPVAVFDNSNVSTAFSAASLL